MTPKMLVPSIRFKGFTDPWEQRKLADIAVRLSETSKDKKFPRVEYEDIVSDIGVLNKDVAEKNDNRQGIKFCSGDILYGKLRPYLHNWLLPSFNGLAVGDFWVLQPQKTDSQFLFRIIQTSEFDKIANQSIGTKMPRADWKFVSSNLFFVPPSIKEQQKIGSVFKSLDSLITLHQRKLEKLGCLKKALLEKMFPAEGQQTPEIRFKGFTDPWEQRKLGEISEKVNEKNIDHKYSETFTNSAEFGIISQRDFFNHDITNSASIDGYYIVKNEDFVYNPRISVTAPCGPINRNKLGRNGVMSPLYTVFRTHDIGTVFLEHYFESSYWHNFMYFNGDTGARSDRFSIKNDLFFQLPIPFPQIEEQRKIGVALSNIEDLITLHQRKLEKLKNIKKSLLEKMFVA